MAGSIANTLPTAVPEVGLNALNQRVKLVVPDVGFSVPENVNTFRGVSKVLLLPITNSPPPQLKFRWLGTPPPKCIPPSDIRNPFAINSAALASELTDNLVAYAALFMAVSNIHVPAGTAVL